ncbi:MAG TPA: hypothetical protein VGR60_05050 [Gemmatimonadales bacterium]|nr:hypothetical protein [Gemmatimonadales bacterium]
MRTSLGFLALLAAACQGGTTGPSRLPPLSDSAAAVLGKETPPIAYAMLAVFQQHGVAPQIFVRSLEASAPALSDSALTSGCRPVLAGALDSTGAPLDSDGDGIPDDLTATYTRANCTLVDSIRGTTEWFVGTIAFHDDTGLYAFHWRSDFTDHVDRGAAGFTERHTTGTENAVLYTDHIETAAALQISTSFSHDGASGTAAYTEEWDGTYLPDGGGPLVPGADIPSGKIVFSGIFDAAEPAHQRGGSFTVWTSEPIYYSVACGTRYPAFTRGVIAGQLAGDASAGFTATFTGCHENPTIVGHGAAP